MGTKYISEIKFFSVKKNENTNKSANLNKKNDFITSIPTYNKPFDISHSLSCFLWKPKYQKLKQHSTILHYFVCYSNPTSCMQQVSCTSIQARLLQQHHKQCGETKIGEPTSVIYITQKAQEYAIYIHVICKIAYFKDPQL